MEFFAGSGPDISSKDFTEERCPRIQCFSSSDFASLFKLILFFLRFLESTPRCLCKTEGLLKILGWVPSQSFDDNK